MKKFFVGAILTFAVASGAGASIISRGFFDEAMNNYALKTDIGGISALETKIGTMPTGTIEWLCDARDTMLHNCLTTPVALPSDIGGMLSMLFSNEKGVPSITNLLDMMINGGFYGIDEFDGLNTLTSRLNELEHDFIVGWTVRVGYYDFDNDIPYKSELFNTFSFDNIDSYMSTMMAHSYFDASFPGLAGVTDKLLNGWTNSENETYLGIKEINNKVKATELPNNTDDGQYVLTAKKVNGTVRYTWVKMDLTSAEQNQ